MPIPNPRTWTAIWHLVAQHSQSCPWWPCAWLLSGWSCVLRFSQQSDTGTQLTLLIMLLPLTPETLADPALSRCCVEQMSYNNYLDGDAAYTAVSDIPQPACVVVKHTNPCGAATREDLLEAYRLAVKADPISAFGGIVAFNR